MGIIIKFADKNNTTIVINNIQEISPTASATITDHKVESGSDISDNIHVSPEKLNIRGIVHGVKQSKNDQPDAIGFSAQLETNFKQKILATITTPTKVYKNYAIESFSLPLQKGFSLNIPISITFREIQTAFTKTAKIPASYFKTKSTKNRFLSGKAKGQATKENLSGSNGKPTAKPKTKKRAESYLKQLINSF